jgi:hypothetical protein
LRPTLTQSPRTGGSPGWMDANYRMCFAVTAANASTMPDP